MEGFGMKMDVAQELKLLKGLCVADLREKYYEVFGGDCQLNFLDDKVAVAYTSSFWQQILEDMHKHAGFQKTSLSRRDNNHGRPVGTYAIDCPLRM
jgi:hypothetical protein